MKDIVTFLQERLKNTLPGNIAHQRMLAQQLGTPFRMQHEKPARKGAVMILLYPDENGRICFPLTQRHNYVGVHGGQVSLPGGKRDKSDPSLVYTAIRETREEIGVSIQDYQIIGSLSDLHITASNFIVSPIISFTEEKPEFIADPYEVEHIFSTEINHLLAADTIKETELTVGQEVRLKAPYFDIDGKIVWGATAMILSEFLSILKEYKK